MTRSVRRSFGLRLHGKLTIDHIPQGECRIEIEPQPGRDDEIRVNLFFAGQKSGDSKGDVHHPADNPDGRDFINEGNRDLVGIGYRQTLSACDFNALLGHQQPSQGLNKLIDQLTGTQAGVQP